MEDSPDDYEATRQKKIAENQELLRALGMEPIKKTAPDRKPSRKKMKSDAPPSVARRTSARIAARTPAPPPPPPSPASSSSSPSSPLPTKKPRGRPKKQVSPEPEPQEPIEPPAPKPIRQPAANIKDFVDGWDAWTPAASQPTRDEDGVFHFADYPEFRPNKHPSEIIREGSFGGSYWRPLWSKKLGITVTDDWQQLPTEWVAGVEVERYLTSREYQPEINKAGVACGQSIEQWEDAGWIMHKYDIRGWFQWYCRFFQGRRCADDERQVGRWARCVGVRGRWKRVLLKQYLRARIHHVMDEEGGEGGTYGEPSPVVTQTCLHWAYEVRQPDLDEAWANGL